MMRAKILRKSHNFFIMCLDISLRKPLQMTFTLNIYVSNTSYIRLSANSFPIATNIIFNKCKVTGLLTKIATSTTTVNVLLTAHRQHVFTCAKYFFFINAYNVQTDLCSFIHGYPQRMRLQRRPKTPQFKLV